MCTPAVTVASSGTTVTTPWPSVDTVSAGATSPRAASGRPMPAKAATASTAAASNTSGNRRLMPSLRRCVVSCHSMEYRFVDCRWALDDPGLGRRAYLEAHIPGAAFLDVERDLAAPAGARRAASTSRRRAVRSSSLTRGHRRRRRSSSPTAALGGAERLWWLLRHFGHERLRGPRPGGLARAARGGEEPIEPAAFEPRERDRRHDRARRARARPGGARRRRRAPRAALARRAERGRPRAGPHPGRAERAVERAAPGAARGRARRLLRLGRHRVRGPAPPPPRRSRRAGSTRVRGPSGSSIRSCPVERSDLR